MTFRARRSPTCLSGCARTADSVSLRVLPADLDHEIRQVIEEVRSPFAATEKLIKSDRQLKSPTTSLPLRSASCG